MKIPLSERMRPKTIDDVVGQSHLIGKNGIIRKIIAQCGEQTVVLPSMIFWGAPGIGKTTLAMLIAQAIRKPFFMLSAISAGVKEVRDLIAQASAKGNAVLFIDEIHRFNKSQQDALLNAIEKGIISLIGATTENPSFEINSALLSRCQVYVLHPLEREEMLRLLKNAIEKDEFLRTRRIHLKETEALLNLADGDARKLLNLLELVCLSEEEDIQITDEKVLQVAQQRTVLYDKDGEQHYDIISAFIKSVRGSDPNAAVYWLARMIQGGESPTFIARRLLILAAEDIGNANPTALVLATSCFQAVEAIGYPEAEIILAQCATYLASSPKSNASYVAIKKAKQLVEEKGNLPVPLPLRNAPTPLMKELNYGKDYRYAHDYEGNFVE
ncbi:MAG: replication-associated recombination protein A, partial [Flammeovirgaceae bacterium]|nr:replication-associated recombination protein A [Flammeovirgaceae bacterium]MDW8288483.1 replication-associated recombination protein A [Flammeovirgaceae bacterium]